MMKNATFLQNHNRLALVGLVCCLPALLLVSGGLLQSVLGLPQVNDTLNFDLFLFHPAVILGGLIIGFMLNALSVLRIDLQFREDMLISTLRLKINWLSLGLIGLTLSLVSIIFVYLLAENFQIFQTVG